MSKDGHLVVMHDASINRTTNGAGNVSGLTLAQLANFKITKNINGVVLGEGVAIPTLRDVFEALAGTDLIFVVEIKTGDLTTASKLKALVEEFDCLDQVVVIAFGVAQLERFKTDFPEVPTANLNNISTGSFASALHSAGSYNSVIDTHYNNVNEYFTSHDLRDRGFLGYYWTYGNYAEIASKFGTGVVGMTNNAADSIGYYPKELVVKSGYVIASRKTWKTRDLTATTITYDGQETDVLARVFMTDEREDGNYVILSYRFTSKEGLGKYTLFTEPVKVIFEDEFIAPSDIVSRIDALPSDITLENGNEIRALRRAYDALPLSEQALVTNLSKLVGHEKTLGRLESLNNSSSFAPSTSETPSQNSSGASSGSGCKSSVAGSAMGVMLLVCAMAVVLKRKN